MMNRITAIPQTPSTLLAGSRHSASSFCLRDNVISVSRHYPLLIILWQKEIQMRYFILLLLTTNVGAAVLSNDRISCSITANGIQSISFAGRRITTDPSEGFPRHQGFYASSGIPPATGTATVGPVLHTVVT